MFQEWLRVLWHCTHPAEVMEQQKEIQRARSLNLVLKECKLNKPSAQVNEEGGEGRGVGSEGERVGTLKAGDVKRGRK